jgi:hypothetical protein
MNTFPSEVRPGMVGSAQTWEMDNNKMKISENGHQVSTQI